MVDLIGLYENETGTFPIATWFPTLRYKTEVSRAMEPLGQNRSRTSLQDKSCVQKEPLGCTTLQDRNPACKETVLVRTYDTLGRALVRF